MATIFGFLFQYSEVKSRGALRIYETFIDELNRSDRLVQEDEELCAALFKEEEWIKGFTLRAFSMAAPH